MPSSPRAPRLFPLLPALLLLLALPASSASNFPTFTAGAGSPDFSFNHPFKTSSDSPIQGWSTRGSAVATTRRSSGADVLQLTPAFASRAGFAYATRRVEGNYFEGYVDFEINKGKRSPVHADGLAFWFLDGEGMAAMESGGMFGLKAPFRGLAIVVDTYSNSRKKRHPYVYAWVNDGTQEFNDAADGDGVEIAPGCHIDPDVETRMYVKLENGYLQVAFSLGHGHYRWFTCFQGPVRLPFNSGGYFALSADTGHFFSEHLIFQVQMKATPQASTEKESEVQVDGYEEPAPAPPPPPRAKKSREEMAREMAENDRFFHPPQKTAAELDAAKERLYMKGFEKHRRSVEDDIDQGEDEIPPSEFDLKIRDLSKALEDRVIAGANHPGTQKKANDAVQSASQALTASYSHKTSIVNAQRGLAAAREAAGEIEKWSGALRSEMVHLENRLVVLKQIAEDLRAAHESLVDDVSSVTSDVKRHAENHLSHRTAEFVFVLLSQVLVALLILYLRRMQKSNKYGRIV